MALATFANVLDTAISFEISDDESDCDRSYSSVCSLLVIRKHTKGPNTTHGLPRRIAGSRRVSNYCEKNGSTPTTIPSASVQLLQSITAIPALADRSFEVSPPNPVSSYPLSGNSNVPTLSDQTYYDGRKYGWNATTNQWSRRESRLRPLIRL